MTIRDLVLKEINIVAAEQDKTLPPLTDDLALLESGLELSLFRHSRQSFGRCDRKRSVRFGKGLRVSTNGRRTHRVL